MCPKLHSFGFAFLPMGHIVQTRIGHLSNAVAVVVIAKHVHFLTCV